MHFNKVGGGLGEYSFNMNAAGSYPNWTTITLDGGALGFTPESLRQVHLKNAGTALDIDNIGLVPEPATAGLLAVGALALLKRKRK